MTDDATERDLLERIQQLESEQRFLRAERARLLGGSEPSTSAGGPIFVGGTGRSGTWVIGRLLARHPDVVAVHTELRVHASHKGGFRRVLELGETPREFADFARDHWFAIKSPHGGAKGLALVTTATELAAASERMVERAEIDRAAALGGFLRELVDPYAYGRGALRWIETTPDNSSAADCLIAALPDARVINVVRDGRDVVASASGMPWGPNRVRSSLRWWASRIRAAHAAMSAAPADRVLTVRFEELVVTHRQERLEELVDFVGLDLAPSIQKYFDQRVTTEAAHVGRWRAERARRRDQLDARYRKIYARLEAEGVRTLPIDPDRADALARGSDG